jgi:hypothetical protein
MWFSAAVTSPLVLIAPTQLPILFSLQTSKQNVKNSSFTRRTMQDALNSSGPFKEVVQGLTKGRSCNTGTLDVVYGRWYSYAVIQSSSRRVLVSSPQGWHTDYYHQREGTRRADKKVQELTDVFLKHTKLWSPFHMPRSLLHTTFDTAG